MDLLIASIAVTQPMGQQVYEEELISRAASALPSEWSVRRCVVRTLRSTLPGTTRIPSRLLADAPAGMRAIAGSALYRGADLVHRMDLRLPPAPGREVLTVHDVAPWRFEDEGGTPPADSAASARRSRAVVCPSAFAAGEVATVLGVDAPIVVHNGVSEVFFGAEPLTFAQLQVFGITGPYVLHAGGCTRRKNLGALAEAWPRLRTARPGISLVMIGPPDQRRDALFGPLEGVLRLGRLPGLELVGMMAAAAAVVVPSIYEGFGLPAIEAMAAGVPVVASSRSALPEVCGDGALLVEPTAEGLLEGVVEALDRSGEVEAMIERGRKRARRFTWQASVEGHVRAWLDAVA